MKKLNKFGVKSTRDDSLKARRHIHSLHILAFATGGGDFTKKENAHFDLCRSCRLKTVAALKNLASPARAVYSASKRKAA